MTNLGKASVEFMKHTSKKQVISIDANLIFEFASYRSYLFFVLLRRLLTQQLDTPYLSYYYI